ncbi:MAG: DUF4340 domain-containing protein [Acidobacteria bacterium]|nr:DUF4340 domain-containing protein [Acidobacteriota bacterium]
MKKGTLLMVLLAMALGGAVWYLEFKRAKPAEDEANSSKPLFTFKQEEITALTITRGSDALHFEKRGEAWRMTQPLDSATDADAVSGVLSSIVFARISRTIAVTPPGSTEALKPFGLDAPGMMLEIKLKAGATHRLRLGAKDFNGSNVYALVDNSAGVALVPNDVLSSADKPLLEFRDRRIAVFEEADLVRLRLKNEHGTLAAAKNAEGKWIVSEPAALRGKEVETERIVNAVREARADGIVDSPTPAERARLARPLVEVELTAKDGATTKVEFSAGKGDVYVRSSLGPMLFKVARPVLDALNFKPAEVVKKEEPKPEETAKESPAKKRD